MLLNMRFSLHELHSIFFRNKETIKITVRYNNDKSYQKGTEVDKGIYDINGFQVRFFSGEEIRDLVKQEGFETLWIEEEDEEPVTLFSYQLEKCKQVYDSKTTLNAIE